MGGHVIRMIVVSIVTLATTVILWPPQSFSLSARTRNANSVVLPFFSLSPTPRRLCPLPDAEVGRCLHTDGRLMSGTHTRLDSRPLRHVA